MLSLTFLPRIAGACTPRSVHAPQRHPSYTCVCNSVHAHTCKSMKSNCHNVRQAELQACSSIIAATVENQYLEQYMGASRTFGDIILRQYLHCF